MLPSGCMWAQAVLSESQAPRSEHRPLVIVTAVNQAVSVDRCSIALRDEEVSVRGLGCEATPTPLGDPGGIPRTQPPQGEDLCAQGALGARLLLCAALAPSVARMEHTAVGASMDDALLALPSSTCIRMRASERCSVGASTNFVIASAGLSRPRTLWMLIAPGLTLSCSQRSAVARCRMRPRPRRLHTPMAAVESEWSRRPTVRPRSAQRD